MRHPSTLTVPLAALLAASCSTAPPPPPVAVVEPAPPPRVVPVPPPKVALVLGGGGARGFAHVGVLRVLEQARVPIDLIVGTSVGSLIGAMYATEPNAFQLEWKAFEIEADDVFDFSLFKAATGPVAGEAVRALVRKHIGDRNVEELKIPFVAVATDLRTGERVDLASGPVVDAVRASVSIPGVFSPARMGDRVLVDGGVVANVAVDVARDYGADVVIASSITQDVVGNEIDDVVDVTLQAINIMMDRMAATQLADADVVIAPAIGDVGTMDFSQKKRCMQAGIDAASVQVPAIKAAITRYYVERGGAPPMHLLNPEI